MHDEPVTTLLERMPDPVESPTFFDELWVRAEASERAAARRWRRIAILVAAAAVTAAIAGGVVAATRSAHAFDTTVSCAVEDRGGLPYFALSTNATLHGTGPKNPTTIPALFYLSTGQGTTLLAFDRAHKGYLLDNAACHRSASIPLRATGLPRARIFRGGGYVGFNLSCTVGHLQFRVRLTQDSSGNVSGAKVAIRATKKAKPIAYIDWTPARVAVSAVSPDHCAAY